MDQAPCVLRLPALAIPSGHQPTIPWEAQELLDTGRVLGFGMTLSSAFKGGTFCQDVSVFVPTDTHVVTHATTWEDISAIPLPTLPAAMLALRQGQTGLVEMVTATHPLTPHLHKHPYKDKMLFVLPTSFWVGIAPYDQPAIADLRLAMDGGDDGMAIYARTTSLHPGVFGTWLHHETIPSTTGVSHHTHLHEVHRLRTRAATATAEFVRVLPFTTNTRFSQCRRWMADLPFAPPVLDGC